MMYSAKYLKKCFREKITPENMLSCLLTVFIVLTATLLNAEDKVVDTNFNKCIENTFKKPVKSLSNKDYLGIKILSCPNMKITNISGIERFANLVELDLKSNQINDITPIKDLSSLTKLYLWKNKISDISPVSSLGKLIELYLEDNLVEDIGPVAQLRNLNELLLGNNKINDISSLSNLTRLKWLELFNNRIVDISPLKNLKELCYLDVSGNNIQSIAAISKLTRLNRLFIQNNMINDINSLSELNSLEVLFLNNNAIPDIHSLSNFKVLRQLKLDNNRIKDLSPLHGSTKLKRVSLLNNCITNTGAVGHAEFLEGMEYQHHLCDSPNLTNKNITNQWLKEQIETQCIDYGDNDYSLKSDYEYFPDGIYYVYYSKDSKGNIDKKLSCRLPWNSKVDNLLGPTENLDSNTGNYKVFNFNNNQVFVQKGLIKGYSLNDKNKIDGRYSILDDISDQFHIDHELAKERTTRHPFLTSEGKGYFVRIEDKDNSYSLQFFEPDFFNKEIISTK